MQIWAAEIFTQNLPEETKRRLLSLDGTPPSIYGIRRRGFEEIFVLVTDSQFVVYGVGESIEPMLNFFLQDPSIYQQVHFYKSTEASVNHLFATTTGLCSDLKGVRRVSQKVHQAHYDALQCGGMGLVLDNLVRQSMRVSRKVRKATGIENLGQVLVDAGMEIVFNQVDNPFELSYLILGTGDIAKSALEFFHHEGFRNIVIASEDEAGSRELAEKFSVSAIDTGQISTFIQLSDVVITEDSRVHAFSESFDGSFFPGRQKIFLDFGNSFSNEEMSQHPMCRHYTIEDINNSPAANANVFHSLEEAWQLIEVEAKLAVQALNDLRHVPLLRARWKEIVTKQEQGISILRDLRQPSTQTLNLIRFCNNALLKKEPAELPSLLRSDHMAAKPGTEVSNAEIERKIINAFCTHLN